MKAPRYGGLLLGIATVELLLAGVLPLLPALVFAYVGVVTASVGLATWMGWTGLLGKTADGRIPLWSLVGFASWHVLVRFLGRVVAPRPRRSEVAPGLFVGAWPHPGDFQDWPAVLDVTCELPRVGPADAYLCLPTWDRSVPTVEQLDRAVAFVEHWRARGRDVLVHCTQGRGRSVTVATAVLAARGIPWEEAKDRVLAARPGGRLASVQKDQLAAWSAARSR